MSIATSTSKTQYTLSAGAQALPVPFYFLEDAHVKVIKAALPADIVLVKGTDYTISGSGSESGGTVTTIAGTAADLQSGDKITIKRSILITQQVNYVYNDRFPAETHERALDKLTMIAQEMKETLDRAIQFPESEVNGTGNIMPSAAERAAKLFGFDAAGTAVQLYDPVSAVFAEGDAIYANTVAALKAVDVTPLLNGQQVHVAGYSSAGDGGGGTFAYVALSAVTENVGTIVAPNAGAGRWYRVFNGPWNVKWFGAKGDGATNDSVALNAAITAASAGQGIFLPQGTYVAYQIVMKTGVWLLSAGATIKCPANGINFQNCISFSGVSNCGILGRLTLDGNFVNQTELGNDGVIGCAILNGSTDIYIESVFATGWQCDGLYIGDNTTHPQRISIGSYTCHACGRNGASITAGKDIHINRLHCYGTVDSDGTGPGAGLDIEPNGSTQTLENVTIDSCVLRDNEGMGLQIAMAWPTATAQGHIHFGRLVSTGSTEQAGVVMQGCRDVTILSALVAGNYLSGVEVRKHVSGFVFHGICENNRYHGLFASLSGQSVASRNWNLDGSVFRNNGLASAGTYMGAFFASNSASYVFDNISLDGIAAYDDQGSPTQGYGVNLNSNTKAIAVGGRFYGNTISNYVGGTNSVVETRKVRVTANVTPDNPIVAATVCKKTIAMPTGSCIAGDDVVATPYEAIPDGLVWSARVSATDTVELRIANPTAGDIATAVKIWSFGITSHQ